MIYLLTAIGLIPGDSSIVGLVLLFLSQFRSLRFSGHNFWKNLSSLLDGNISAFSFTKHKSHITIDISVYII